MIEQSTEGDLTTGSHRQENLRSVNGLKNLRLSVVMLTLARIKVMARTVEFGIC